MRRAEDVVYGLQRFPRERGTAPDFMLLPF